MDDGYEQIAPTSYHCSHCGYDLSGSAIGGSCPECGTPVADSLRFAAGQTGGGGNSTMATTSLILGIIGLTACGLVGPVAIYFYYRAKADIEAGIASPGSLGTAKAGLILGWISTVLLLGVCVFYGALVATGSF